MALCWNCHASLPETPEDRCPACGAERSARAEPSAGAAPLPGPPPASEAAVGGTPWDERERLGIATALVDTTRMVLTRPAEFFRVLPRSGGIGEPLLYAVIVGWLGVVAASLYGAIFRSIVGSSLAAFGDRPELAAMISWAESWVGFVVQVVFGGVFVAVGVFITAAIVHLSLLLLGGARSGFEATFRVVCFSQATSLVLIVPFCGQLIAPIWTLVIDVIGLAQAHRIGHGRAAAAVLLPIVVVCCCCAGAALLFAGALASLVGHTR
jgi:hypothetical protein